MIESTVTMNETGPRCLLVLPLVVAVAACDDPAGEPDLTAADLGEQAIKTSAEWLRAEPYAAADLDAGRAQARACLACHSLNDGGSNRIGPNLYGFFGRGAGGVANYAYSEALTSADFVWTPRALDAWLRQPAVFLPGNRMIFAGVRQQTERRDLIAFLLMTTGGEGE